MNGEVQLIVRRGTSINVENTSNVAGFGDVGSQRIIVNAFANQASIDEQTITLINGIGQTNVRTVNSIQVDTPTPGFTRINFYSPTFTFDFSEAAGGYFIFGDEADYFIDLYENESISQNWSFTDIGQFTTQSPFTRNFRIPLTANNQLVFGALFDVNVSAGDDTWFNYKLNAELRIDGLPISEGYLRVSKVYKQKDKLVDLDVTFYASVADFAKDVNQKKISELDWPANDGLVSIVNVEALDSGAFNKMYALIDRGQLFNQPGGRNTFNDNIYAGDLTPCVKWSHIFEKIMNEAGWQYEATTVIDTIAEWWMPFCNAPQIQYGNSLNSLEDFQAYLNTDITLGTLLTTVIQPTTEAFDNGGNFTAGATSTYSAPVHGTFNFNFKITYSVLANAVVLNQVITLQVLVDNVTTGLTALIASIFISSPDVATTNNIFEGIAANITANQNDLLRFRITYVNPANTIGTDIRIEGGASNLTFFSLAQITNNFYGGNLDLSLNAPDMRQIDFVTDVIKMLNCAVVPHPSKPKTLIIAPMDEFIGSGGTIDWTNYLDIDKDITIQSTTEYQKSILNFTYSAGADSASKAYQQAKRIYGDYRIDGFTINETTAPNEFTTGNQTVQLTTQSTPLLPLQFGRALVKFVDDSGQFVKPGARALYRAGTVNCVKFYRDNIGNAVKQLEVPILSHYSEINPSVFDYDLNFAPEIPLGYSITANPYNNLYTQYWMNYLNGLYSPDARIMEAFFALPMSEIATLDFSKIIWIKDAYYRLLSINDYKIGAYESTMCKLIKIIDAAPDCTGRPSTIEDTGEVVFIDINDNVIAATEACCVRYGYTWSDTDSTCYGQVATNTPISDAVPNRSAPIFTKTTRSSGVTEQMVVLGDSITTDSTNVNAIIAGSKISVTEFNQNTLAIGESLELTKSVAGNTMLGKNVTTNLPGIHVGGGYRDGNPAAAETGWAQFGQFALQRYPTISASGQVEDLYIEGVAGEYIEMPDDTLWSCVLNATIKDAAGASFTSLLHFSLSKIGGIASASAISTISTIGVIGLYAFTFGIDTVTDTSQHRINVTITGVVFPAAFIINTSLQYQQNKTS